MSQQISDTSLLPGTDFLSHPGMYYKESVQQMLQLRHGYAVVTTAALFQFQTYSPVIWTITA